MRGRKQPFQGRSVVAGYLSDIGSESLSGYDLSVFGPNGFFRRLQGSIARKDVSDLGIEVKYERSIEGIELKIKNPDKSRVALQLTDAYQSHNVNQALRGHDQFVGLRNLQKNFGWYDLIVETDADPYFGWQVAGHLETGETSRSDPAIGNA